MKTNLKTPYFRPAGWDEPFDTLLRSLPISLYTDEFPPILIGSYGAWVRTYHPRWQAPKDIDLVLSRRAMEAVLVEAMAKNATITTKGKGRFSIVGLLPIPLEIEEYSTELGTVQYFYQTAGSRKIQNGVLVPSLNDLYAFKMSHRFLKDSPHFLKTMQDIHVMRRLGATQKLYQVCNNWWEIRERATYDYPHPNLNQAKNEFFATDGVEYVYDHDSIHEVVAFPFAPAYTLYADDDHPVRSSRVKFFENVQPSTRLRGVAEETTVLALERGMIPFPQNDPHKIWLIALQKVCSSITSGWFRAFAWEHYEQVLGMYNPLYYEQFTAAVKEGRVKPYERKENV